MSGKLKLKEAIKQHEQLTGVKVSQHELCELVEGKSKSSRYVTLSRLVTGKAKNISPDVVIKLCEKLKCDPNYLFGWNEL